jgi:hypothetical protein
MLPSAGFALTEGKSESPAPCCVKFSSSTSPWISARPTVLDREARVLNNHSNHIEPHARSESQRRCSAPRERPAELALAMRRCFCSWNWSGLGGTSPCSVLWGVKSESLCHVKIKLAREAIYPEFFINSFKCRDLSRGFAIGAKPRASCNRPPSTTPP